MAESAQLNILIEKGADFVLPYTIYDNNGNPVDLTGSTITSHLRRFAEASGYSEFICIHNGKGGRITINMPKEITSQISYPKGVYDVKVMLADGFTSYTVKGNAEIREGVTKPIDGTMLYLIGIERFKDLPAVGNRNRLYFCYEDRSIYKWNGANYIVTAAGNGIQKIEKTGTTGGIVDHYRITYDDGTYFNYIVTNGRGVSDVSLISTEDLVKTYRMSFEDGNHFDFEVTDGGITYGGFEVDLSDGCCYVTIPDDLETPEFNVNQTSGQMEVII